MGHVPSKEFSSHPFVVDLRSTKNVVERLVSIALTQENFPTPDDLLFQKFCAVRRENPVRHWYCRPPGADPDDIPDAPSTDAIYERMVMHPTRIIEAGLPIDEYTPLPIMLVRMDEPQSTEAPNGTNCSVVGYFGCRHFNGVGDVANTGVIGMFLSTKFYNEAKSLFSVQIACACYQHFSKKAGCTKVPWPKAVRYDTFQSNLPCLRLTQKMHSLVAGQGVNTTLCCDAEVDGDRAFFSAGGDTLAECMTVLANMVREEVDIETGRTIRVLRPEVAPPPPPGTTVGELTQKLIAEAKVRWSDANAAVVSCQLQTSRAVRRAKGSEATKTKKDKEREKKGSETERKRKDGGRNSPFNSSSTSSAQKAPPFETMGVVLSSGSPSSTTPSDPNMPHILMNTSVTTSASNTAVHTPTSTYPPAGDTTTPIERVMGQSTTSDTACSESTASGGALPYPTAHYPRETVPLRRLSGSNPDCESTLPWNSYSAVSQQSGHRPSQSDYRVFLGDRTPVYVCIQRRQWEPVYWRDSLSPLRRSTWQPHLEDGFVCYEVDHTELQLYDAFWRHIVQSSEALIFLELSEIVYTLDEAGNYIEARAA